MHQNDLDNQFCWAISEGDLTKAKNLVLRGANISAHKDHALLRSIFLNRLDMVKYLVSQGMDLTLYNYRALNTAGSCGHAEIERFLRIAIRTDKLSKMLVEGMLKDASN